MLCQLSSYINEQFQLYPVISIAHKMMPSIGMLGTELSVEHWAMFLLTKICNILENHCSQKLKKIQLFMKDSVYLMMFAIN